MKRLIALVLTLCTLLSAMPPVILTAQATEGAEMWDVDGDGTLSILAVGDEFSEDILTYVRDIAHNLGISRIFLGNLSTEDGSLADHWAYAQEDNAAYTYFTNADGKWLSTEEYKLSTALTSRSWDFVTLQQAGDLSGREETYGSHLTNLVNYVKAMAPNAKLAWNMTWAYREGSDRLNYGAYADQTDMHHSIVSAVMNEIVPTGAFAKIVPLGAAAQNSRTSLLGDIVCREDGYRLSEDFGRYLAAMTFVHAITELDIFKTTWAPENVPFAWQVIAAESAANAVSEPFSIIYSMHDDVKTSPLYEASSTRSAASPAGDSAYARNYPQWTVGGYYNNQEAQGPIKTASNSKYYWCTLRYSKTHLPVGSVIHLGSGYKFRMEAFLSSGTTGRGRVYTYGETNADSNWTGKYLTITDSHWKDKNLLAFNVSSSTDNTDITGRARSTMDNNFKIYYSVGSGNLESFSKYVRLKYSYEKSKYWHCTDKNYWKNGCTTTQEANAKSFIRTPKYTESDLPAGTIIYVNSGWKWRSDCWTDLNARYTGTRPPESHEVYTRLSDAFWRDQPHRAFNISTDGEANLTNYSDSTIRDNFRIYVPISVHNSKHKTTTDTTDSTCTQAGVKKTTCPGCNYSKEEVIAKKAHNSNTVIPAVAPTCTKTGLTEGKKCSACGTVTVPQQEVPMLPHPYVYAATTEPTLTSTGVLTGICSVCGGTTTVTLPVLNTTDYSYTVLDGGTCVASGIERYTWKNTEYGTFYFDVITATTANHSYDTGTVTTPPTCSATGVRTYTCQLCSSTKMEPIAIDPNAHNWDSGKVTLLPTPTQTGVKTFTCTHDSAHTKTETIPVDTTVYVTTHMGQYAETLGGSSQLREDGKGAELADNADLNVGDVAVYSFDLLNEHEVPVYNISFADDKLGVSVSPDEITLNQPLSQQPLAVYYYPTDGAGNMASALPVGVGSVADMQDLIRQANTSGNSAGGTLVQNYVVQITSEQELRDLLALGVPRNCKISLYGFTHVMREEDAPFSNTLDSRSYFNRNLNSQPGSPAEEATLLTGSQTRTLSALRYPTAEALQIVMDYGKPVHIPHEELISRISDNGSCVVGELVGLTMEGNDTEPLLTDAPETMKDFDAGMGVFTVTEDGITYEPKHFLSEVERVYAVYRLEDCYGLNAAGERVKLNYILVKIEIIPANMMYYEAEDFKDTELSYEQVGGSFTDWEIKTDNTGKQTYQDLDPAGYRTYNMVIDRDNIPAEGFFADFDGLGYSERYRDHPQYGGYDFDAPGTATVPIAWRSNREPGTDTVPEVLVLDLEKGPAGEENYYHYVQPVIPGGDFHSTPLSLKPGAGHIFQIRFRTENCVSTGVRDTGLVLYFSDGTTKGVETNETPPKQLILDLDAEEVFSGNYYTVTASLDSIDYYTEADLIDAFRVHFTGLVSNGSGRIMIDYIYLGPETGMKQEAYGNYLFFGFDNTTADQLRYESSAYGSTATSVQNYDSLGKWSTDRDSSILSVGNGYLVFKDAATGVSSEYIHAGSATSYKEMTYTCSGNDICQVRMKIENGTRMMSNGAPLNTLVRLEFIKEGATSAGTIAGRCYFNLEEINNGDFQVFNIPLNTADYLALKELTSVRISTYGISGATYTVDYIYVGPEALLGEINQKADYIFFDFTDTDADKLRYSNPIYNGRNYDASDSAAGKWCGIYIDSVTPAYYKDAAIDTTNGILSVEKISGKTYSYAQSGDSEAARNLRYDPGAEDWFQIRFKMDSSIALTADSNICLDYMINSNKDNEAGKTKIPLTSDMGFYDGYITLTAKITDETFLTADYINGLRISFKALTEASTGNIYIDSIYIGPLHEVNPAAHSLYFGFENTEADQLRYNYHTYGGYNYDVFDTLNDKNDGGHWATSPQVNNNSHDLTIDNETGTLNVRVTDSRPQDANGNYGSYGPYVITTSQYGAYSMSAARASLHYRPENAEIVQVRFRVKNCEVAPGTKSNLIFLFGGYNQAGQYVDYNSQSYMREFYTISEGYQVVSIRVNEEFRKLAQVTNLGLRFQNIMSDGNGSVEIDYIYVGTGDGAPYTYGYDGSYQVGSLYSNGTSLYTKGNGVRTDTNPNPAKYTEAKFSFTGTGFDLISRTDQNQASIRVEIFTDSSRNKESRLYGTDVNLKGELDLYQIPVYSRHGLPYGTYYVTVGVKEAVNYPIPALARGNEFYLDAIRIYDPIDVSKGTAAEAGSDSALAYAAYCADGEAHPIITEVRDILLTAEDYAAGGLIQDGAVYVDYSTVPAVTTPTTSEGGGEDITDPDLSEDPSADKPHITTSIQTYKKIGPNNETYLGPQQLVAFQLLVYSKQLPARVDIGAKGIIAKDGIASPTNLEVKVWNKESNLTRVYNTEIQGPSHQYYSLHLDEDMFVQIKDDNGDTCYMTTFRIGNSTPKSSGTEENILSITDVKVAYKEKPTSTKTDAKGATRANTDVELPMDDFEPIRFVVTGNLMEDVLESLEEQYGSCKEHTPGDWQTVVSPGVGQEGLMEIRCTKCGTILETEPVAAIPAMAFAGASVSLQSDLAIHYKVNETFFTEQGFADPFVVVSDNGLETVIREYTVKDGKYSFIYKNIAPHRIGDTVTATLYAYYNGELYAFESRDYSVADYCYNMLNKFGTNDSYATLRTLLVDILHYGAESQRYTKYRTDSLCTVRLTEEQLSWGTELTRELVNHRDQAYEVIENPTVEWKGAGLNLQESVAVRFKISAESYEGLEVKITLEGWTETVKAEDFDYRADGTYVHFTSLNAAQMSSPIYVATFRDGVQVSNTICYSIESYAYAKQNDTTIPYLASLVKRMMCYGDSARAYIGK